jgi:hypothetical protein
MKIIYTVEKIINSIAGSSIPTKLVKKYIVDVKIKYRGWIPLVGLIPSKVTNPYSHKFEAVFK